jgi:hypothetical protein
MTATRKQDREVMTELLMFSCVNIATASRLMVDPAYEGLSSESRSHIAKGMLASMAAVDQHCPSIGRQVVATLLAKSHEPTFEQWLTKIEEHLAETRGLV